MQLLVEYWFWLHTSVVAQLLWLVRRACCLWTCQDSCYPWISNELHSSLAYMQRWLSSCVTQVWSTYQICTCTSEVYLFSWYTIMRRCPISSGWSSWMHFRVYVFTCLHFCITWVMGLFPSDNSSSIHGESSFDSTREFILWQMPGELLLS